MTAKEQAGNPENKTIEELAKLASCKPNEILSYKEYPDKWVLVVQTAKSVRKQELKKNA